MVVIDERQKPVFSIKTGGIEVSAWEKKVDENTFTNFQIKKNFKDKQGTWKKNDIFSIRDMPKLIAALNKAYEKALF